MSTLIDLAIFPLDKGVSVSTHVARAAAVIRDSGLAFTIGPMGTSIEGEWGAVMAVVERCMTVLQEDCDRIYATIKVDYRKGPSGRIEQKVAAVAHPDI
jgi:uncharacterized protein (TIGR00106 family)